MKCWDSLPPDVRTTLEGVVNDTTEHFYKASRRIKAIWPKPEKKLELKKSLTKFHRNLESRVSKELIDSICREVNVSPDKL